MAFEKIKFFGHSTADGGLKLSNSKVFNQCLRQLAGKQIAITLEEIGNTRTLEQNALYWKYLGMIADSTGDTTKGLHAYFKDQFLPPRFVNTTFGEVRDRSTSTVLTKKEFSDYMTRIEVTTGVPIPNKDEANLGYSLA